MVSDAVLESLDWSEPAARRECSYESAGWSCHSTGFLWFSEVRTGDELLYPCPRCNVGLFLKKSKARGTIALSSPSCICCGPSMAHLAYQSALEEVRSEEMRGTRPGKP